MDYDQKLEAYTAAVEAAGIELKGKSNKYTSHQGHMFSFLGKDGVLAVRLSKEGKAAFNEKHGTSDVIQYNSVMNGYVEMIPEIAGDQNRFKKLLKEGYDYVDSLPAK